VAVLDTVLGILVPLEISHTHTNELSFNDLAAHKIVSILCGLKPCSLSKAHPVVGKPPKRRPSAYTYVCVIPKYTIVCVEDYLLVPILIPSSDLGLRIVK